MWSEKKLRLVSNIILESGLSSLTQTDSRFFIWECNNMHSPVHLKDPFLDYLEEISNLYKKNYNLNDQIEIKDEKRTLEWVIGRLWNCTDIMPRSTLEYFDLTAGMTYALFVRKMKTGEI
jgi:hypothetical protein